MLRLSDAPTTASPLDEWPLPIIPAYVEQTAQLRLTRDLRSYTAGEIEGRSYLIAGHRGAGKTALITRVIDLLRIETLRASVREETARLPEGPFQRPLLVKLHGPSMLDPEAQSPAPAATADPAASAAKDAPAPPTPGVHAALVQIGIGLYRALSAETATGFRAHARTAGRSSAGPSVRRPGGVPTERGVAGELAAQLALDLDGGASPGRLREYWVRIGRLYGGVLWPRSAEATLVACRMEDQGAREIVALATASQAFEVCSGRVTYGTTRKNSDVQNATSELKGSTDLRDVAERLGSLGLGTVVGVAALSRAGAGAAIAAGLLTWGVSTLAVTWSRTRTRNDDQTVDYSFIRDRDPSTLDRDLPVVITRLRQAGLAPVFVIDELDKLDKTADEISKLVKRLKHLVADFGFFCFLVDRACYEELERRADTGDFPMEHTLFSDRVLLTPEPDALYRYLLSRITSEPATTSSAHAVFALETMHRARLNLTQIKRLMARAVHDRDGALGEAEDFLLQRRQIVATFQLAVDEALRSPLIINRTAADPAFAQLAIDSLYYPFDELALGNAAIDASKEALSEYLRARSQNRAHPSGAAPDPPNTISDPDLSKLQGALVQLLESLADLKILRAAASRRRLSGAPGAPVGDEASLLDVIPPEAPAIVRRDEDGLHHFAFTHDGEAIGQDPGRLSEEESLRAAAQVDFAEAFQDVLSSFAVSLDELSDTPLMSGLSDAAVVQARRSVRAAVRLGVRSAETNQHLATLDRLAAEVRRSRAKLALLLAIVSAVRIAARGAEDVVGVIRRMLPLSRPPRQWLDGWSERVSPLPLEVDAIRRWRDQLMASPAPRVARNIAHPEDYQRFVDILRDGLTASPKLLRFRYEDLVMAAKRALPYRALTTDIASMTAGDWSAMALASLPTGTGTTATAPYWVLVASLRGLGFGAPALSELIDPAALGELQSAGFLVGIADLSAEDGMALAATFASAAPQRPTGALVIDTHEEAYGRAAPTVTRPTLVVHADAVKNHAQALNWLAANGILSLGADARPVEASDEG